MLNLVAKKIGMTHKYNELNALVPITIIQFPENLVIERTSHQNYDVVKIAFDRCVKTKNISKSIIGLFTKNSLPVFKTIKTSKIFKESNIKANSPVEIFEFFKEGDKIDISGTTIGKGFAGSMKRWNFRGLEASHGVSVSHRSHGSTGQRQDPGKVFKGKKMAGHMGCDKVTVKNLEIVFIDKENSVIGIKGAIPGNAGGSILVKAGKYL